MDKMSDIIAREEECERAWRWLVDALHIVAETRADEGEAFRIMQQQVVAVGQRRVELMLKRAALETWRGTRSSS